MKTILKLLVALCVTSAAAVFFGLKYIDAWSKEVSTVTGETIVELRPGMPLKQLAIQLEKKNLISDHRLFWAWMRVNGDFANFQAGTYQFKDQFSPEIAREKMKRGDVFIPLVLQVTIPEGFNLKLLNMRLATKNVGKLHELTLLSRDAKFIASLGINAKSLEGFTYPATYSFDKMPSGEDFYRKAVKTFFERLPDNYEENAQKLGLTLTQAVTFASLIEMETMQEHEKPMIAEVIWARLKKSEPLGIDAAVIYGIPNYDGDIRTKDLKDSSNPYNTRIHRGLPPTPIGAVSKSSLEAVLYPTRIGNYYYMLDSTDHSRHVFSKTIKEHNALVQKFLKKGAPSTIQRSFDN
jgi:UPF0755 protein